MRLKPGLAYFAVVFTAGFALGSIRVPLLVPRLGERTAELIEMPFMFVAVVFAARWVITRLQVPATLAARASMGIVAHEIGHAMQDATNYGPLRVRSGLVPIVSIGSWLGPIVFFAGWLLSAWTGSTAIAWIGLFLFAGTAVFALITLPVERNASRRALQLLQAYGLADGQELQETKQVLDAAALTYVAALVQSLSTLLYYFFLLSGSSRRD
jgi:Zn-dependent membrane protease YugP